MCDKRSEILKSLVRKALFTCVVYTNIGYLSADIICSGKRTVFQERSSKKTVSFEEQIMSKDKYSSIFSRQMEATVFIILPQIFFTTSLIWKIGEYSRIFPSSSWGIFGHVTCLDQPRASENI